MDVHMQLYASLGPSDSQPGEEAGRSPGWAKPSALATPRALSTASSANAQSLSRRTGSTHGHQGLYAFGCTYLCTSSSYAETK
jgi:hypothetical protein